MYAPSPARHALKPPDERSRFHLNADGNAQMVARRLLDLGDRVALRRLVKNVTPKLS